MAFLYGGKGSKSCSTLSNLSQQFGDKILYEEVSVQINRGEKVGLIGRKRCRTEKVLDQTLYRGDSFFW